MLVLDLVLSLNGSLGSFKNALVYEHGSQGANPWEDKVNPSPISRSGADCALEGLHRDDAEGNCEVLGWWAHISNAASAKAD